MNTKLVWLTAKLLISGYGLLLVPGQASRKGCGYPDFVKNEAAFRVHRDVLIRFADMLYAEGIKYDYQSDWNFLLAAIMYDKSIVIL
jgi:hypothetical protein